MLAPRREVSNPIPVVSWFRIMATNPNAHLVKTHRCVAHLWITLTSYHLGTMHMPLNRPP